MAGIFDAYPTVDVPSAPTPIAAGVWDAYPAVSKAPASVSRPASGLVEHIQAGFQASAPGLAWRGKLPELVADPATSNWWERMATGVTQVAAELPIMIPAGAGGAVAGTAAAGPVGGVLAGGAAMFAAPAAIRTSLMEAYKAREASTPADWFAIVKEVAKQTASEAALGAVTMGTGALAKAGVAAALGGGAEVAKAVGTGLATPLTQTGARAAGAADVAAQIAAMVTLPAAAQGHLPELREFGDAAAVILTLKGAHVGLQNIGALRTAADRIADTYTKTGRTPAQQVVDAQANPEIVADLTRSRAASGKLDMLINEAEFLARGGVPEAPNIKQLIKEIKAEGPLQGDMIADIDRIGVLNDQARQAPLTNPERAELEALRARLRGQVDARGGAPSETTVPLAPTAEQLTEAGTLAKTRLEELDKRAEAGALTDQERVERIMLNNAKPEDLARHFKLAPSAPPSADAFEASAQKIYDDFYTQGKAVDQARQEAGQVPLGDDNLRAAAVLVRRNAVTLAKSEGILPEDVFLQRQPGWRDEAQIEAAIAEAAIPADAVRFELPAEVDLFGAPVQAPFVPRHITEGIEVVQAPVAELKLSLEVPQFKKDANEQGVVKALGGTPDSRGWAIQVWERLNGDLEVISGRHRLDLWRREGRQTIPAQIHREADGFTAKMAAKLDAELNIRDEQGSTADYVQYFKDSGLSKEEANKQGLLARAKGKDAFAIAENGTDALIASNRAGVLSDEAALAISANAPKDERMQNLGMAMILEQDMSILMTVNMMKAYDLRMAERMAKGAQGDMFNFNDADAKAMMAMAKKAMSIQRKIGQDIAAVIGAAKNPVAAKRLGVDVADPEGVKKKVVELRQKQDLWDNWPLHPELVAELKTPDVTGREGDLKQGPVDEKSPEFKKWFGDSKVVDAEGKPMMVFHGTADDVTVFDLNRRNRKDTGWLGTGVYVTRTPDLASSYSHLKAGDAAPNVIPLYVKLENPYIAKRQDKWRIQEISHNEGAAEGRAAADAWTKELQDKGYDGVILEYKAEDVGPKNVTTEYVVFDPASVKSAIGNRGTFDPKDSNILHQEDFALLPETPAELAARNAEAVAQARRKIVKEDAGTKGSAVKVDQADLFNEQSSLFQSQNQDVHRASYNVAERLIKTMEKSDKSSVLHELGHHFLENLKFYAERPGASERTKAMWETARQEFAIGEAGDIPTASHETMAKSWERYLGEGEAPTPALRTVFEQFRTWMLEIYNDLKNIIGTRMNPEVKSLFDRMLATDEEIADARALNVPRAYVADARATEAAKIVTPIREIEPRFKAEQISMDPYADELPKGPGEAPDKSHINYKYVNAPIDVKLTLQKMAEIDQTNIQEERGGGAKIGVKTWREANAEQMKHLAEILEGTPDQINAALNRLLGPPPEGRVDRRLGELKKFVTGAAKDSARLRDEVLTAGEGATLRLQLEYMGSIERTRMIQAEFLAERASVARALNALKDLNEGSGEIGRMLDAMGYGAEASRTLFQDPRTPAEENAILKAKLDEILLNYKGKSVLDIARLHKEIGTLKGTVKFSKEVTEASTWEKLVEGWKAGLLSGPQTPVTNVLGTWSFQALRAPVDALAAIIGMARGASPGMGESDRASMSEALARITGPLAGMQDALKAAGAALRVEQDPSGKTESYRTAISGRLGEIIRFPFRLMSAGDVLTTTMYKRGELKTLAIRQAFNEELNPGTREFAERVQTIMDSPPPEIAAMADAAATRMAFNDPGGERTRAVQTFVNKWNLQWMIPFIRTPMNIAAEMLRMTPGAPLIDAWRADIAKGGVARDKAIAEVVVGSGIMALTMAYAFSGQISGSGSPDPGKNRSKVGTWQPNSVLIGDTWYEIGRLQPGGTLMVLAADVAMAWDHMTDEEKDKVPKILAMAFSNAITNQTFLQGITNVVHMMSEPDRYGSRFFQGLAGSMVPNVIGQPTAMADPYVRQVNSMLEAIQARLPGRESLEPKIDWLGEPVKNKERLGAVLPIRETQVSEDKVRLEADKLGISVADAPKKTHLGKGTGKLGEVELTPEERTKFAKISGEMAHKILTNIVTAPGYDSMPELIKKKLFANVLTASHKVAAVQALPPEKRASYLQAIIEKVAQELAPTE